MMFVNKLRYVGFKNKIFNTNYLVLASQLCRGGGFCQQTRRTCGKRLGSERSTVWRSLTQKTGKSFKRFAAEFRIR